LPELQYSNNREERKEGKLKKQGVKTEKSREQEVRCIQRKEEGNNT
jgi:hypothetical protein